MGLGVVRVEADRFAIFLFRVLRAPLLVQYHAQVVMGDSVVWVVALENTHRIARLSSFLLINQFFSPFPSPQEQGLLASLPFASSQVRQGNETWRPALLCVAALPSENPVATQGCCFPDGVAVSLKGQVTSPRKI
jgi:hypothetical protein